MPATALIKFVQGANVGTAGIVLVGVGGVQVDVSNGNNAGIASWEIDLVDTPPGSSVARAIHLATNNNGSTPAANFTPDVRGCYRVATRVWGLPNKVGVPSVDIRNFIIPGKRGLILPPYQKDPDPLPTLASAEPGAKPNEMNVGGSEKGWEGGGGDGLLADLFDAVDGDMSVVALSGAANTLTLAQRNKWLQISHTAATTLTVPPNSSVAFPISVPIVFYQAGVGQVTVAAGAGVTVRTAESLSLAKQYSLGMLFKVGTNEWVLTGDLELL